jgi:hypothetical protein
MNKYEKQKKYEKQNGKDIFILKMKSMKIYDGRIQMQTS